MVWCSLSIQWALWQEWVIMESKLNGPWPCYVQLSSGFMCSEGTCTLYRNHSDGIYRVGHTTLILYHILELARALTSHYFFTVSGKDLNGSLKTLWPWLYPIITIAERLYDPDFIKTTCSNSSSESNIVEIFHADLSHRHPPSHPCVSGRFIVQRSFWFVWIWSYIGI